MWTYLCIAFKCIEGDSYLINKGSNNIKHQRTHNNLNVHIVWHAADTLPGDNGLVRRK